jgi:hypothetical protein
MNSSPAERSGDRCVTGMQLDAIRDTPHIFPDAVILSSLTASTMVTLFQKNVEKQTLCG